MSPAMLRTHRRSAERIDYANGFKPKTVMTRMGELTFAIPQVRGSGFYPSALAKGSRTGQAGNQMMAEKYVHGASTRKVIEVLQQVVGQKVSIPSTQVSRAIERRDTGLAAWRERPLGPAFTCGLMHAMSWCVRPAKSLNARP